MAGVIASVLFPTYLKMCAEVESITHLSAFILLWCELLYCHLIWKLFFCSAT